MLINGEIPTIYGLDLQARSLAAVQNSIIDTDDVSKFLIGTQSLCVENQVHLVAYDSYTRQIEKSVFSHNLGEIWGLTSFSFDEQIFASIYAAFDSTKTSRALKAHCWRFPEDPNANLDVEENVVDDNSKMQHLQSLGEFQTEVYGSVLSLCSHPDREPKWLMLTDNHLLCFNADLPSLTISLALNLGISSTTNSIGRVNIQSSYKSAKWSPHDDGNEACVVCQRAFTGWDLRASRKTFEIEESHGQMVRDVDYNPYKQYQLASCGDDGLVCLWDVRAAVLPVASLNPSRENLKLDSGIVPLTTLPAAHSHWVYSVRYNPSQDMLLLSCGSDACVVLYSMPSFCSSQHDSDNCDNLDNDLEDETRDDNDDEQSNQSIDNEDADSLNISDNNSDPNKLDNRSTNLNSTNFRGAADISSLDHLSSDCIKDEVLKIFDGHEESVYCVEWSQTDPWVLASLSYDGRLVINHVPIVDKLRILRNKL